MNLDFLHLACPTCANNFHEAGGDAAGWAIMFMVVVVVSILASIGFFMVRIARRESAGLDPQFQDS
jgi:hypothetical protein